MRNIIFLLACVLIGTMSYSQVDSIWTLQDCIAHAQDHNLNLSLQQLDLSAAEIEEKRAKHSRYPSLSGSSNFGYNFGRTIDPTSNSFITTALGFNGISLNSGMTVFAANRINYSIRQAKINREAALASYQQAKQDVALQVANLYLNALLAKENVIIAQQQLDAASNRTKRSRILVDKGAQNKGILLDLEAEEATQEQNAIAAENNLTIALLQLKQTLLLPADTPFEISSPELEISPQETEILQPTQIYKAASKTQYSIKAAAYNVRSSQLGRKIAHTGFFPSLTVGGNLNSNFSTQGRTFVENELVTQRFPASFNGMAGTLTFSSPQPKFETADWLTQMDENLGYGFGLQLNVPIYNNFNTTANYQQAKINEIRAEKQYALTEQQLRIDVERAITDLKAAAKSYRASERAMQAAQMAYDNATAQFEAGVLSTFDLFDSQQRLQTSKIQLLLSKYDYIFRQKIIDFYLGNPIKL